MVRNRENPQVIISGGGSLTLNRFDLNFFVKYVSFFENIRFAPKNAGPQPLGDFTTLDLTGGYTLRGKVPVRIYLRVRNMADRIYSTVVGYPDFGRSFYLGMNFSFKGSSQ